MSEHTHETINDLRRRILDARAGLSPMPTEDELREAYTWLRSSRTATQKSAEGKKAKGTAAPLPADLNDLF